MNVETISMDPRIARIHYRDYMEKCRGHRQVREAARAEKAKQLGREMRNVQVQKSRMEQEDRELLKAYKALCKAGTRIIDLPQVIRAAGLTEKEKLPALACCPADAHTCDFNTQYPRFNPNGTKVHWKAQDIELTGWPAEITDTNWRNTHKYPIRASALVPTVPPHLRPDDLSKYHILWECTWAPQAPGDPLLLSRINKHQYAVVAQWDLSPLEQRVLEGRLTRV